MPDALLIAHGAPSDPAPQERTMAALASDVTACLPAGWRVLGATLAAPGAVEAGLAALDDPLIFPFLMAEGYFTRTLLPRRLKGAGAGGLRQLPCFGAAPGLPDLIAGATLAAALRHGLAPQSTALLLAAHGSEVSRASAEATLALARRLAALTPFARITAGFVEEAPFIEDAARGLRPALCLPLFALRAGHVEEDLPQALARAGFDGPVLPPLGEDPGTPALIAAALQQAAPATK